MHMKEVMKKEFNVDADKIKLINFGTDIIKFCPKPKTNTIRKLLNLNDVPIVISTRWLSSLYDIETLIRAIPIIKKEISNVHFIIGGEGPEERNLKNLSITLGVEDNITFTGFIQNDELPLYLTESDIYVSTSLSDAGLAASTAEAMACGLPVVITDFGNNNQWVSNGEGGFLFPLHDYQALALHIINLLKNEELMKKCGERNHNLILEHNNYFKTMKEVEEMCQKLLEGRKK
jgi:L-malate glycosyltransferase